MSSVASQCTWNTHTSHSACVYVDNHQENQILNANYQPMKSLTEVESCIESLAVIGQKLTGCLRCSLPKPIRTLRIGAGYAM